MTCLTPWGILFFSQLQVQVAFVVGNLAQLQVDGVLFLRGKVNGGCALTENALVAALAPVQLVSVQVGEQVFVDDKNLITAYFCGNVLIIEFA